MGERAVDLLLREIEGPAPDKQGEEAHEVLHAKLVVVSALPALRVLEKNASHA